MNHIVEFILNEDGTESVEWGILSGLLISSLIVLLSGIGSWIVTKLTEIQTALGI